MLKKLKALRSKKHTDNLKQMSLESNPSNTAIDNTQKKSQQKKSKQEESKQEYNEDTLTTQLYSDGYIMTMFKKGHITTDIVRAMDFETKSELLAHSEIILRFLERDAVFVKIQHTTVENFFAIAPKVRKEIYKEFTCVLRLHNLCISAVQIMRLSDQDRTIIFSHPNTQASDKIVARMKKEANPNLEARFSKSK